MLPPIQGPPIERVEHHSSIKRGDDLPFEEHTRYTPVIETAI